MSVLDFVQLNGRLNASAYRRRKLQRACYDCKITMVCGFLTFMLLRSCLEGGRLRTPMDDLHDLERGRRQLQHTLSALMAAHPSNATRSQSLIITARHDNASDILPDHNSHPSIVASQHPTWGDHMRSMSQHGILLVTGSEPSPCKSSEGDFLLLKSVKNKLDYCRVHGIQMFYEMKVQFESRLWGKFTIVKELLESSVNKSDQAAEWIWWVDSDALFTNMSSELPMDKYAAYNMVILQGWDYPGHKRGQHVSNTKSFLIRKCQWSLDLLQEWLTMELVNQDLDGTSLPEFEGDYGSSFVFDLLIKASSKWSDKIHVETTNVQVIWNYMPLEEGKRRVRTSLVADIDQLAVSNNQKSSLPLLTHFVGCKPCSRIPIDKTCTKHMEKAFHFANDAALKLQALQDRPSTSAVMEATE